MQRYFIGLDGGSTYLKAAMIDEWGRVVDTMVRNTGIDNSGTASALVDELCHRRGITRAQVGYIMATGYSRKILDVADDDISEITAHAYGVRITAPPEWRPGMIVDVGGQDSKIIYLDANYAVKNFTMNDKCAAGTGRFFEAMARSFEMSLSDFSKLSLKAKNIIPITAQCTVFAESEVITLVGEGKAMDEIAAGIEMAVAKRCFVMAKKAGATDSITLTGGCAKNDGLKDAIEKVLKIKVVDLAVDPQLMGALGAAEYARQKGRAAAV